MAGAPGIDAILFDLGNVLIPIDIGRTFEHWARAGGLEADVVRQRWSQDDRYRSYERGHIGDAEYFTHLRERLGLRQDDEQMLAGWNAVFLDIDPEVEALVEELSARYPLYLFSNTNRAHQDWFTPRLSGMLSRFQTVFTSCDIGYRKPDVEAFLHVASRMGVAPGRIAFFDDLPENVAGARAAGLQAHRVQSTADIRRALP